MRPAVELTLTPSGSRRGIEANPYKLLAAALVVVGGVLFALLLPASVVRLIAIGLGSSIVLLLALLGKLQSERLIAAYWIAFAVFSTILIHYVINGMFIMLDLALLVGAIFRLLTARVRIHASVLLLLVALLGLLLASSFEMTVPTGALSDRLRGVLIAIFISLQITTLNGARLVRAVVLISSVAIAAWVIINAAQSGFAYRAHIDVNQNVVSLYIGMGLILALGDLIVSTAHTKRLGIVARFVGIAIMLYAMTLLASRGSFISLGIALLFAIFNMVAVRQVSARGLIFLPFMIAVAMFMPGAAGLIERFNDPELNLGGGRTEIWQVTLDSALRSDAQQLLLGHGTDASAGIIRSRFPQLTSTHNSYLHYFYNHGIVGLLLLLLLHLLLFYHLSRIPAVHGFPWMMVLVFQMSVGLFMTATDNYLYWAMIGIIAGYSALLAPRQLGPRTCG